MPQLLLLCMLWFCLVPPVGGCSRESLPAGTVATVNGHPISLRLLNAVQVLSYFQRVGNASDLSVDALRKQYGIALASLIVHSLVAQDLRKNGLDLPPEQVRAEEARIRADYPGGEFEQALLEGQMDIQTWRELLHNQLALELFAAKVLSRDLEPSLQEVQAYYERHAQTFSIPASLYLRIISGAEQDQVKSACAALQETAAIVFPSGVVEQKTAMPKAAVPEEWRKDIEALKPGEMSPVRKIQSQYQAVQMLEVVPASHMSIVEAYPLIEQALIAEKLDEKYADWIEQAVQKADIRVSVYLREHSVPADRGSSE
ncbi:MAG: peptidyl-prolyl cis-trans isomerase [Desulfovibrionaceae bacterium]|nr:peptidyl-prolyl cis-trans isomerase [Desulfovibrionaceae bacterium]